MVAGESRMVAGPVAGGCEILICYRCRCRGAGGVSVECAEGTDVVYLHSVLYQLVQGEDTVREDQHFIISLCCQ